MASKAEKARDLEEARAHLLAWCPRGSTVYLSGYAALVLGWSRTKEGALKLDGCGMDMGYHAVHSLSTALYGWVDGQYSHEGAYALKHEWI